MKLNFNKPYGEVYGHPLATYEQDGKLFDSAGAPLQTTRENDEPVTAPGGRLSDKSQAFFQAHDFLEGILKEGPLTQRAIYKECESNNQDWEAVKAAFADMGGETFKQRNGFYWRLKAQ